MAAERASKTARRASEAARRARGSWEDLRVSCAGRPCRGGSGTKNKKMEKIGGGALDHYPPWAGGLPIQFQDCRQGRIWRAFRAFPGRPWRRIQDIVGHKTDDKREKKNEKK